MGGDDSFDRNGGEKYISNWQDFGKPNDRQGPRKLTKSGVVCQHVLVVPNVVIRQMYVLKKGK